MDLFNYYELAFSSDESFSIDNLKDISFNIISILKRSGFLSLKDLIVRGPFEVSSETGIDIDDSFVIFNQALSTLEDNGKNNDFDDVDDVGSNPPYFSSILINS